MSSDLWHDLLACLVLSPLPRSADDPARADRADYEGRNQRLTYHRLFGGQLLGQFVRAAALTCPDKSVKSLHVLFPRAGAADEPVRYEVARHHEGGTFATLAITARQSRGAIATASVSLHTAEDGPALQTVAPVPAVPGEQHRATLDLIPWEARTTADLDSPEPEAPELELWLRSPDLGPDAEALAPALTAYATDLTLIGTALRPVDGVSQRDAGTAFTSAVTSHTLWFHRPFRTDDWLLLRQHSPLFAHARSFGRGDVLTADGAIVASYAQESLLRFKS